jgi:putative membrane protein
MNASSDSGLNAGDTDKTSLALDRTVLANERTYAAWIRTGLAALITGLGIARFMADTMPLWSVRLITAFLILFSAQAFLIASWRYGNLGPDMSRLDVKMLPQSLVRLFSLALAGCSLFALIGLWYMGL